MQSAVKSLRPPSMRSRPMKISRVFDDPDVVMALLRRGAPYENVAAFHKMDRLAGANARPFFRTEFTERQLLNNPHWIEAAKTSFGASIVRPFKCLMQLTGPMGGFGVHFDGPLFRGLNDPPVWLMMTMVYSGLFQDWMVPIASGLCWYYPGQGGSFVYWPDGPHAPAEVERAPFWNRGVMCDNEYLFHGVSPVGTPEDIAAIQGTLDGSETLHAAGQDEWEIRKGGSVIHRLRADQLRISLLWKAYVFEDEAHLASFEDPAMHLTYDQIVEIFQADLAAKGITLAPPHDLATDGAWRTVLEDTYKQPLSPHAADEFA